MLDRFLEKLRASLKDGTFVKLTLSRPRGRAGARNVYGRLVELKGGAAISFTVRHARRDVTRNEPPARAVEAVRKWIEEEFEEAHLFTTAGDWRLRRRAEEDPRLRASRPAFAVAPPPVHDQVKRKAVGNAPFLVKLGVTAADGSPRAGMAGKLRQVERFVEILGHLVDASPLARAEEVCVCDMGAGKGYLTFAVHDFFLRRGARAVSTGVEQRADLVDLCNRVAEELSWADLTFALGSIGNFPLLPRLEVLLALHACDTATDDALAAGIQAGAKLIVVAPCCQKEVRQQLAAPPIMAEVLRHGILAERQAELLTDGWRAMALEACGYEAKVFEFISTEHTGKNVMIAATKRRRVKAPDLAKVRAAMAEFGVTRQRLLSHLERSPSGND